MHPKCILLFLLSVFILLPDANAQVLYRAELPQRLEDLPAFCELTHEREEIFTAVSRELNRLLRTDLTENEAFYLQVWMKDIDVNAAFTFREKYALMNGARRFGQLDTALLFRAEDRLQEIESQLQTLRRIYEPYQGDKMAYYIPDTIFPHTRQELRFYQLQPGERIAEVGAGSERFAACIAATLTDITLYINDVDTAALRQIAYHLAYNPVFDQPGSAFYVVTGRPLSTGLEPLRLDHVIVRDAFHHFDHPQEMLSSIRQSLKTGGRLYLKERYTEDCGHNCCRRQMSETTIKEILESAGFELQREATIRDDNETRWHLLALTVGEEWR